MKKAKQTNSIPFIKYEIEYISKFIKENRLSKKFFNIYNTKIDDYILNCSDTDEDLLSDFISKLGKKVLIDYDHKRNITILYLLKENNNIKNK